MTGVFRALWHFVFGKDLSSAIPRQGDQTLSIVALHYILILKQAMLIAEGFLRGFPQLKIPEWTNTEGAGPKA